jgi:hypothetical protein
MVYFFNLTLSQAEEMGYKPKGNIALIVSGARIDHYGVFEKEIKKASEEANPNLKEEKYVFSAFVVSYKNDKENKSDVERITNVAHGKVSEDQHFYIIQPLEKIVK